MRAVVTGGAGFIGSHLVDRLVSTGNEVLVIDDLSTGLKDFINPSADFKYGSVSDSSFLSNVFDEWKPEIVFHLAAQVDVVRSIAEPDYDAEVNIVGTINVLKASAEVGVRKIVFTSSAAVYGEPTTIPVTEESKLNPQSPYGIAKASAEMYLKAYSKLKEIEVKILRLANVYGPRQGVKRPSGIISIMISNFLRKIPVELYDPSNTVRDFIYVHDVVDAMLKASEIDGSGTFNISSGQGATLIDIFEQVRNHLQGEVSFKDARPGEIKKIILSNELAKSRLSWIPQTSLEKGIAETAAFWKEWLK